MPGMMPPGTAGAHWAEPRPATTACADSLSLCPSARSRAWWNEHAAAQAVGGVGCRGRAQCWWGTADGDAGARALGRARADWHGPAPLAAPCESAFSYCVSVYHGHGGCIVHGGGQAREKEGRRWRVGWSALFVLFCCCGRLCLFLSHGCPLSPHWLCAREYRRRLRPSSCKVRWCAGMKSSKAASGQATASGSLATPCSTRASFTSTRKTQPFLPTNTCAHTHRQKQTDGVRHTERE
jgi:hypothetical protein